MGATHIMSNPRSGKLGMLNKDDNDDDDDDDDNDDDVLCICCGSILFLVMVIYDNKFETKENKIQTKKKNEQ